MTALLPALVLGAVALPPVNRSELEAVGRSYGNSYNNYNSYYSGSKDDYNSVSSAYIKGDPGSYAVGSGYVGNSNSNYKVDPGNYVVGNGYVNSNSNTYSKTDPGSYVVGSSYTGNSNSNTYSKPDSSYGVGSSYVVSPTEGADYYNHDYSNYYAQAQERFHPHKSKPDPQTLRGKPEEDSHVGEIVLPPVSSGQDLQASGSSHDEAFADVDPTAQGDAGVETAEVPVPAHYQAYDYAQPTSPPLPGGYDYNPPPRPPPPPPTQPTPYYYYPPPPPSNQYLPAPSHQYLPAPTLPPLPPPPPPPPAPPAPQEERQSDYTYYYLGPKLWYVPLFFSIYFVIYVGALIIKAVSKHKILFPQQLYNAATSVYQSRGNSLEEVTAKVTKGLAQAALRYLTKRKLKM